MGWLLPERQLTPYFFLKSTMLKIYVKMSEEKSKYSGSKVPLLTDHAEEILLSNWRDVTHFPRTVKDLGDGNYTVFRTSEDKNRVSHYSVRLESSFCSCGKWQQVGVPCKHAVATLMYLTSSKTTAQLYQSKYFHATMLTKSRLEMFNNVAMVGVAPSEDEVLEQQLNGSYLPLTFNTKSDSTTGLTKRRFKSKGESGNKSSAASAIRLGKAPCVFCGKLIKEGTLHKVSACLEYKEKVADDVVYTEQPEKHVVRIEKQLSPL